MVDRQSRPGAVIAAVGSTLMDIVRLQATAALRMAIPLVVATIAVDVTPARLQDATPFAQAVVTDITGDEVGAGPEATILDGATTALDFDPAVDDSGFEDLSHMNRSSRLASGRVLSARPREVFPRDPAGRHSRKWE